MKPPRPAANGSAARKKAPPKPKPEKGATAGLAGQQLCPLCSPCGVGARVVWMCNRSHCTWKRYVHVRWSCPNTKLTLGLSAACREEAEGASAVGCQAAKEEPQDRQKGAASDAS